MTRREIVLAALAASERAAHSPVQVQKLLFLLDRRLAEDTGGPHFTFQAHDYGPFDRAVYDQLESLEAEGLVEIRRGTDSRSKLYQLTPVGQQEGERILSDLPPKASAYIRRLSAWVRARTFPQLVSAIYRAYPDMAANSVFRGAT